MIDCSITQKHLNQYLDNEVSPEMKQLIQEHLKGCSNCKTFFAGETRLEKKLTGIILQPAPGDKTLWNRTLETAKQHRPWLKKVSSRLGGIKQRIDKIIKEKRRARPERAKEKEDSTDKHR